MDEISMEKKRSEELRRMWAARKAAVDAGVPEDRIRQWYVHVYGDVPPERLDRFNLVRVRMKLAEMKETQERFDGRKKVVD